MNDFRLTPDAKASLLSLALYTQQTWGTEQRRSFLKMSDECFHALAITPMQGKARPEIHHTLRSHPAGKHIVFYIIKQDHIVIANVLHERMEPSRHLLTT